MPLNDHRLQPSGPACLCRPRDRLRTTTNVLGDSIGAGIVEFLSRNELRSRDVEMGHSVLEERKKPYQLIPQDSGVEPERPQRIPHVAPVSFSHSESLM